MSVRSLLLMMIACLGLVSLDAARAEEAVGGGGIDVRISKLSALQVLVRDGTYPDGLNGMAMATTACNVGTVDVPWFAPMNTDHPIIVQNLYRQLDGVLEQIGAADAKHGFFSTNANGCGVCDHPGSGQYLGPNCDDTYGAGNNSDRTWMAPRGEVNPFTGVWDCVGSHFSGGQPDCIRRHSGASPHTPTEHRLTAHDSDLGLFGASYYYEGFYIVASDVDKSNNYAWRPFSSNWNGSAWELTTTALLTQGALINTWGDSRTTTTDGEGEVILAVKTADIGGGTWHYEYALYNFDLERRVRSFALPISATVNLTNIGFHDPDQDPANDWSFVRDAGTLTWSTDTFAQDPDANALIYGTLFNFRFDADSAPQVNSVSLGLFKPGVGDAIFASTAAPPASVLDCNGNSVPDTDDISTGTSTDCNTNQVPDECEFDCNLSGWPDSCDIASGTSLDCQPNGLPDECELGGNDCDGNNVPDACDISEGTSPDCQPNGIPDSCDLLGVSDDLNGNTVPDECEVDCNANDVPDDWDISQGTSEDCDSNGVPDDCDPDCNENGQSDLCDIFLGTSPDVNGNSVPDECDCTCGDINEDGIINLVDFLTFAACFGASPASPPGGCSVRDADCSDLNGSDVVDLVDVLTFASLLGQPIDPSNCNF